MTQPHELHEEYWRGIESHSDFWYNIADNLDEGEGKTSSIYHVVKSSYKSDRETIAKGGGISYVMKIITKDSKELKTRLNAEKQFLLDADHPSILNCYDSGHWNNYPFYIAEYLPKTLRQLMEQNISKAFKMNISIQLVSALVELEQSDPAVVHRDIKPRNIFISGNKSVIGDFGIMKFIGEGINDVGDIWEDSTQKAMPYFYPTPELIEYSNDEADLTTKTNTYQLGLILAELFTGSNPANPADYTDEGLEYNQRDEIEFVPGHYGGQISDVLQKMLIEDPAERPEASEILDAWEGIMSRVAGSTYDLSGFVFE